MNPSRSWRRAATPALLVLACLALATASAATEPERIVIGPGLTGAAGADPLSPQLALGVIGQEIRAGGLLQGFTLWLAGLPAPGAAPVVVQPQLRTGDGSSVLWQGKDVSVDPPACPPGPLDPACLRKVDFAIPSIRLDGGRTYLIDVQAAAGQAPTNVVGVVWVDGDLYSGGDERALPIGPGGVAGPWFDFTGDDLAFLAAIMPEPNIVHIGYCAVAGNYNPMTGVQIPAGTFLNLVADQPKTDPGYAGATTAIYVEGRGITCDQPPPGYVEQGFAPESLHVPGNVYRYWAPGS